MSTLAITTTDLTTGKTYNRLKFKISDDNHQLLIFYSFIFFFPSMYMSVCKSAEENGVYVLHGNRGSFHTDKQPAFKAIFSSIQQVKHIIIIHHNIRLFSYIQIDLFTV